MTHGGGQEDLVEHALAEERAALAAALAAERARWAAIDMNDPVAVAGALAEVGMRAGAKVSVIEHMHDRIGRALTAFEEASSKLATREDVDERIRAVEKNQQALRDADRRRSWRRYLGLVLVVLIFAAIAASAIIVNRLDIQRDDREDRRFQARSEIVAICASTYPGDRERIRACVAEELRLLGIPSSP